MIKIAFDMEISEAQVQTHKSVTLYLLLSALFLMASLCGIFSIPTFNNVAVTTLEGHQNVQKMVDKSNIVYRGRF